MNNHLWTEIISKSNDEVAKGHHLRFVNIQIASYKYRTAIDIQIAHFPAYEQNLIVLGVE